MAAGLLALVLLLASPSGRDAGIARREGSALRDAGDLDGAREKLLLAALLLPGDAAARRELDEVEGAIHDRGLREGRALLARGDLRGALEKLRRAASVRRCDPACEAEALLRRHDHAEYAGEWLHREDIVVREKAAAGRAERRRAELGLGDGFRLDRIEDVRIFTDHSSGEIVPFTRRLHRLLRSLRSVHAALLLPACIPGGTRSPDGLDVIIFRRREDYVKRTASPSTAGMFLPDPGASVFFLGDRPSADQDRILVHEVCHQLDFKVLGLERPPPWLQEGIASYFEGARISPAGDIGLPGALPAEHAGRIERTPPGSESWWGLERLSRLDDLRPLHGTDAVRDFYAQSALAVRVLLDGGGAGRAIFYGLVDAARGPEARPGSGLRDLERISREAGETPAMLEARLRAAARR